MKGGKVSSELPAEPDSIIMSEAKLWDGTVSLINLTWRDTNQPSLNGRKLDPLNQIEAKTSVPLKCEGLAEGKAWELQGAATNFPQFESYFKMINRTGVFIGY